MKLPKDPVMLYSIVNMKLRDAYPSLDELCDSMNVDKADLESRLKEAGFTYHPENNQFRPT